MWDIAYNATGFYSLDPSERANPLRDGDAKPPIWRAIDR
jgi:hypothetical protein